MSIRELRNMVGLGQEFVTRASVPIAWMPGKSSPLIGGLDGSSIMGTMNVYDFSVGRQIGRGGMGSVHLVTHRPTGTRAALKVMTGDLHANPRYARMFRREVESLARMEHPNVVRVLDAGAISKESEAASTFGAGSPFIIMEYVDGQPPGTFFDGSRDYGWPQLRRMLRQTLQSLGHAHSLDVIHRDLKPNNLLIVGEHGRDDWTVKLFDFGIARVLDKLAVRSKATSKGTIIGTPKFMAPEQILERWRDQGPWTDLYAVGCMAWQASTARAPHTGATITETLEAHVRAPLPEFQPVFPVPEGFETWLRRMLAKAPKGRIRRAADAMYLLDQLPDPIDESSGAEALVEHDDETLFDTGQTSTVRHIGTREPPAPDERREPSLASEDRPAPPSDWRTITRDGGERELGPGLGLFSLRRPKVAGRTDERDELWSAFRDCVQVQSPRAVTIRGRAGYGKSRLARWLKTLTHESGAATTLHATHGPFNGPLDGLGPMFVRHFRCMGLERDALAHRLGARFGELGFVGESGPFLLSAISTLMAPSGDAPDGSDCVRVELPSTERNAAITELLGALSRQRPIILWLDDIQWGARSVDLVRHLLSEASAGIGPILAVMTAREGTQRSTRAPSFDDEKNRDMHLPPLSTADQAAAIDALLPVAAELRDEIVARSEGTPLFAQQLLVDWVDRGMLKRRRHTFVLDVDVETALPDSIEQMWHRRIESVCQKLPTDRRTHAIESLEIAAALGQDIIHREWRRACQHAGLEPPEALLEKLSASGLATTGRRGWSFTHGMLRDTLEQQAREHRRWAVANSRCLAMLSDFYTTEAPDYFERRAVHLREAGRLRDSLRSFIQAYQRGRDTQSTEERARLLKHAEALVARLDIDDDRLAAECRLCAALQAHDSGNFERGGEICEAIREQARRHGWHHVHGLALLHIGNLRLNASRTREAISLFEQALRELEDSEDQDAYGRATLSLASAQYAAGDLRTSIASFKQAHQTFQRVGNRPREIRTRLGLSAVLRRHGELDRAREQLSHCERVARRLGSRAVSAEVQHAKGELARHAGRLQKARESYRRACDLWRGLSSLNRHINEVNRVMVEVGLGRWNEAEPLIRRLRREAEDISLDAVLPILDVSQALVHIGRGRATDARQLLDATRRTLSPEEMAIPDVAWLADAGLKLCRESEDDELADALRCLAELGDGAPR